MDLSPETENDACHCPYILYAILYKIYSLKDWMELASYTCCLKLRLYINQLMAGYVYFSKERTVIVTPAPV